MKTRFMHTEEEQAKNMEEGRGLLRVHGSQGRRSRPHDHGNAQLLQKKGAVNMSLWTLRRQAAVAPRWILVLIIGSILAAIFGFGNFSVVAAGIGRILFFLLVVLLIAGLVMAVAWRRGTAGPGVGDSWPTF